MPLFLLLNRLFVLSSSPLSIVSVCVSVCARVWVCAYLCYCMFVCRTAIASFSLGTPHCPRIITGPASCLPPSMRNPTPINAPTIMPLIRQIQSSALMQGGNPHTALMQQGPESGIIYTPYEYPYTLTPSILEYPIDSNGVLGILKSNVDHVLESQWMYYENWIADSNGSCSPIAYVRKP